MRVARGELLHAAVRADEGEIGDVHRSDEHDEDHAAPEHLERRAHVADDVGLEGQQPRGVAGIHEHVPERAGPRDDARVLRVHLRLGAREGDARCQPHDELVVLAVARALGQLLRREGERYEHPHVRVEEENDSGSTPATS